MTIFFIIVILIFSYVFINWLLDEKAPKEKVEALLVKKKVCTSMNANNIIHKNYVLIFDVKGSRKKFNVNNRKYKQYKENQEGILVYKRKKFVDFII